MSTNTWIGLSMGFCQDKLSEVTVAKATLTRNSAGTGLPSLAQHLRWDLAMGISRFSWTSYT